MKQIFFILAIIATTVAYGQKTVTRQAWNGVTDASVSSWTSTTLVDAASATNDSLQVRPNASSAYYKISLVDSAIFNLKSAAGCYYGDVLYLDIVAPGAAAAVLLGSSFIVSTGTNRLTLTASKRSLLTFRFNGSKYVEVSRNLNYTP